MLAMNFISCTLAIALLHSAAASHFRGGTVYWQHIQSTGSMHELEIYFRLGWRRSRESISRMCGPSTVNNGVPVYNQGYWVLDSRAISSDFPHSVAIICTSYDINADWSYGFNEFRANITASNPFNITFPSSAWISGLAFGGSSSWSITVTEIDLGTRSDTGLVNRPPKALSAPLTKLTLGCSEDVSIAIDDDDGDPYTCRYAEGFNECGGICGEYRYFTLNQMTCTLHFNGTGATGLVPVALMIEDHATQTITVGNRTRSPSDALSSVPLQILFEITPAAICNDKPMPDLTKGPQESDLFVIPQSGKFNATVYAYTSSQSNTIVQFVVIGPLGLQVSSVISLGNNLFASNLVWTPSPTQGGKNKICYYAVDGAGTNGQRVCFTVEVAAIQNPCEVDNGGCSDDCVPQGSLHKCSCPYPCWKLAEDQKTCVPMMNVTCGGTYMDISIQQCASNRTVVAGPTFDYFTQKSCQSMTTGRRHHLIFSPLDCGLEVQANPVNVMYHVFVWLWKAKYTGSSVITRGEWQGVPVTCSMGSSSNLTGSFVPQPPMNDEFLPIGITVDGIGAVTLFFEYYRTSMFSASISPGDYPIEVGITDRIHFALGAIARAGLVFFAERCVAMTNRSLETSSHIYAFIDNGCFIDPSLKLHNTSTDMERHFSMEAFEFEAKLLESRDNAEIFLQCEVRLCDASRNDTRCAQGCLSTSARRKRSNDRAMVLDTAARSRQVRDADEDDDDEPLVLPEQTDLTGIPSRFVLIVEAASPEGGGDSDSVNYTNYILIGIGILLVLIAAFVAYRVMQNRREKIIRDPVA